MTDVWGAEVEKASSRRVKTFAGSFGFKSRGVLNGVTLRVPGVLTHAVRATTGYHDALRGSSVCCGQFVASAVAMWTVKVATFWLQVQERFVVATPRRREADMRDARPTYGRQCVDEEPPQVGQCV